jgi:hypothetical protein
MATDMRKTHYNLKGLAEIRARTAGALQRLKKLRSEVQRKLKVAKADAERYQKMEVELARKLEEARTDLKYCDWLICRFDSRLDPSEIEPIVARKCRYGKRGALKEAVSRILKDHAPVALSIPELSTVIILEFQLTFATDIRQCLNGLSTERSILRPGFQGRYTRKNVVLEVIVCNQLLLSGNLETASNRPQKPSFVNATEQPFD